MPRNISDRVQPPKVPPVSIPVERVILTINGGSSSIKFAAFGSGSPPHACLVARWIASAFPGPH